MGIRDSMTRDTLSRLTEEGFDEFLDDVVCDGLRAACERRFWTQGATLRWIAKDEERSSQYSKALQVRAEIAIHEGREIVDSATSDDVNVAKLRSGWRQWEASKWNRERYGEKLDVKHQGAVGGLTIVVAQLSDADQALIRSPERVVEGFAELEADAGEISPESSPDDRVSSESALPLEESPRLSVVPRMEAI